MTTTKIDKCDAIYKKHKNMTLTIELDDKANSWVESLYTVHPDIKSHTGIYMTLEKDATYTASCKQKLNTKSSREADFVAEDDIMGQVL